MNEPQPDSGHVSVFCDDLDTSQAPVHRGPRTIQTFGRSAAGLWFAHVPLRSVSRDRPAATQVTTNFGDYRADNARPIGPWSDVDAWRSSPPRYDGGTDHLDRQRLRLHCKMCRRTVTVLGSTLVPVLEELVARRVEVIPLAVLAARLGSKQDR